MKVFEELGSKIEDQWSRANYDLAAFAPIATEGLQSAKLHTVVQPRDIGLWLANAQAIIPQDLSSMFGEPPITVFAAKKWAIQVLCWVDGRTTIHSHDFAGAFTVLSGSSIQRTYDFQCDELDGPPILAGQLRARSTTLLRQGDVETIIAGKGLIHSVFHLDRPTLSVVVRTSHPIFSVPQYDYWWPGVAIDPEFVDPLITRRIQYLAMLVRVASPDAVSVAEAMVDNGDLYQVYRTLGIYCSSHQHQSLYNRLCSKAKERFGLVIDTLVETLARATWENTVFEQRGRMMDEEQRFFLATLLCCTKRDEIFSLVSAFRPLDNPKQLVRKWSSDITQARPLIGNTPDAGQLCLLVTDGLMSGHSPEKVMSIVQRMTTLSHIEKTVGDFAAFVNNVKDGLLQPLFR